MLKIKKGDKVVVITGKDRGREGTVELVFPKKGLALVPNVNIYKKHLKKEQARDGKGGIYEIPRPIAFSKIALVDPKGGKRTRVGFRVEGDKKVRVTKKGKSVLN